MSFIAKIRLIIAINVKKINIKYSFTSRYDVGVDIAPFPQAQATKYPTAHITEQIIIVQYIIIFFIKISLSLFD